MITIQQSFISINPFSRTGKKLKQTKAIVMHYTAAPGAPAVNIRNYFHNLRNQNTTDQQDDRYAGAHYAVDRTSIVQAIPDEELAYHVGSQKYTSEALEKLSKYPNDCTIGIEMCIEKDGMIHQQTFQNTVDLTAFLMVKHRIDRQQIWTHKDVVGWKNCPLPWVQQPELFERFKTEVYRKAFPQHANPDCEVWFNGSVTKVAGKAINGEAYIGIRALADLVRVAYQFESSTKTMIVNGAEVKSFVLENGIGMMKAKEWGHLTGMKLQWLGQALDIELSR
jgi:N-acetylmuramoyl-L-alanine amidase